MARLMLLLAVLFAVSCIQTARKKHTPSLSPMPIKIQRIERVSL